MWEYGAAVLRLIEVSVVVWDVDVCICLFHLCFSFAFWGACISKLCLDCVFEMEMDTPDIILGVRASDVFYVLAAFDI
jgi:hypothetical protein